MTQYDNFAEAYMRLQTDFYSQGKDESRDVLYSIIDFSLENKLLLDMGCGFGRDLTYFQQKGARIYGIDESKQLIELVEERNLAVSVQSFENTTFDSNFFDVVVSRFAIQHSDNLEKVFREVCRILKPSGFFVYLAGHPLMQFSLRKEKSYWKRETISVPLFDAKLHVKEPTHTFSEYLSSFVFSNFEVLSFSESPKLGKREVSLEDIVPDYFVVKMRKRQL